MIQIEGTFAIIAALLVLLSARRDPRIAVVESVLALHVRGFHGLVHVRYRDFAKEED